MVSSLMVSSLMVSPLVDAVAFGLTPRITATEGASCSRTASWLLSDPEAESLTFHTTLQGWALAPGAWETREDSYCSSPSDTFQRLAFWPVVGAAAFATGPNGTIRVLRTGHITGHVRLSSRGSTRTASSSRYHGFNRLLIAGWSTLRSDASLPFRYRGCRGETGACGACRLTCRVYAVWAPERPGLGPGRAGAGPKICPDSKKRGCVCVITQENCSV